VCGKVYTDYLEAIIRRIVLIHWDAPEAQARVTRLESMGYSSSFLNRSGPALLRKITDELPSAVVIDLSRLPAQGGEVAAALRAGKLTRRLPIVFVDGLPEKVLPVRQMLPDAVYSTWTHLAEDLPKAISRPPIDPIVPAAAASGVVGKSIAEKLSIQAGSIFAVLNAPPNFIERLEPLPKGASVRRQMSDDCDLVVWFVRTRRELQEGIVLRTARLAAGRLWILFPKKASGQSDELSANSVRELGLGQGLAGADKSVSIDADWAGLLLLRAKA
jgi:CheY-like chemotaxis protein